MKTLEELRKLANIENNPDIFEWFCETCRTTAPANKRQPSKCCHTPKNVKIFLGDTPYDNDAWSAAGVACEIIKDLTPLIDEVERLREHLGMNLKTNDSVSDPEPFI